MLRELRIKNFAVIDELALELGPGLNVLTGETGAGKSLILNALGLIAGGRISSEMIRHNEEEASVEALFDPVPEPVREILQSSGCALDDGLIIKRVVSRSGKNRIYLGGSLCPLNLLRESGHLLVHIYGQHEQQTLLKPETHISLLDAFGGLGDEVMAMREKFRTLATLSQDLRKVRDTVNQRKKEKELLAFKAEEIVGARLKPGEEEELQERKNILVHAERLYQGCREGEELLYEGDGAVVSRVGRYVIKLRELAHIDGHLENTVELVQSALAQLEEANGQLRRYAERVHFDPAALEEVENRLGELHRLKRKYNATISEMLDMQAQAEAELRALERDEEGLPALEHSFDAARRAAWDAAAALSVKRQRVAKRFKREIEREAKGLGIPDIVFEVRWLEPDDNEDDPPFALGGKKLSEAGTDQVEFYFSPNRGEPPRPLAKIASGGELSRIMLAIKSLALAEGAVSTLLFDEVDAGIGGAVAEVVGHKLKQVAAGHQVLCVTHLPQIAALADTHHVVRKETSDGRTLARVHKLAEQERIEEVARMLGGIKLTERTRRHAEEMVKGSTKLEV